MTAKQTMTRGALIAFACLAVAANLLLPQSVLSRKPCCFDENGSLRPASAMPCKQGRTGAVRIEGEDCCAPTTYELRPSPPPACVTPVAQAAPDAQPAWQAKSEPVRIQAVEAGPLLALSWYDTGPPRSDPLALYVRLNI